MPKVSLSSFTTQFPQYTILLLFYTSKFCIFLYLCYSCPTWDLFSHLPFLFPRLHPAGWYTHSFMISHCLVRPSGLMSCKFRPLSWSPNMLSPASPLLMTYVLPIHLSGNSYPVHRGSWSDAPHPHCTTCTNTSLALFLWISYSRTFCPMLISVPFLPPQLRPVSM